MTDELFGEEWSLVLNSYLKSNSFINIGTILNQEYESNIIIPNKGSPLFFKVFKDLQPSKIKVVILGQDPYPQEGVYTGYAFDNANSLELSPSLRNIFREINRSFPIKDELFLMDDWDLSRWVRQGVFLVNTALTVIKDKPGSHLSLWKPFTIEWIKRLSEYKDDLIWMLWGNKAQEFEQYINNKTNIVIKAGHPSPLNTSVPFIGSDCFVRCNEELLARNKYSILW